MKLLEGSRVKFILRNNKLILVSVNDSNVIRITNGQGGVKAAQSPSVRVCETLGLGSIPDSGLSESEKIKNSKRG